MSKFEAFKPEILLLLVNKNEVICNLAVYGGVLAV